MKKAILKLICSWVIVMSFLAIPVYAQESENTEKLLISELNNIEISFQGGNKFAYTGKKITPAIKKVTFINKDGETVSLSDVNVERYKNNVNIGKATVIISIAGYEGTATVENAFEIVLGKASSLKTTSVTYNKIKLSWKRVHGASGYAVYRSDSEKGNYKKIVTLKSNSNVTYIDKGRSCGTTYYYKVAAYRLNGGKSCYGDKSVSVSARTVPESTKFTKDTMSGEKHAVLCWEKAVGATGYTIYRSTEKSSGYEPVKHIKSGNTLEWKNTGLKAENVYYFKVRPYVVRKGKKIYGTYSPAYKKELLFVKIQKIQKYTYVSYRYGGYTTKGWDCSGFTKWAMRYLHGVDIEKHSSEQARGGKKVDKKKRSSWKQGDILAYSSGGRVNHVALYLGDGKIMHALNEKYDTIIQDVDYYESWDKKNNLKCVRRYF